MPDRHELSDPNEWIDLYGDYLFRFALLRVRHTHIAEDLLQEALLAALQSRRGFGGQSPERYWLLGILKHKLVDYYRKAGRERPEDIDAGPEDWHTAFDEREHWKRDDAGPKEWAVDPETILEQKQFWDSLLHCLEGLPARHAHAYTLREIDGMKGEAVCRTLGISESNLWVILYRVRLHLRRCLERNWQEGTQ